jgi:hypothetical protein
MAGYYSKESSRNNETENWTETIGARKHARKPLGSLKKAPQSEIAISTVLDYVLSLIDIT